MRSISKAVSGCLVVLVLSACGGESGRVTFEQAWISPPIAAQGMLAGYGVLENGTDAPVTLNKVTSADFGHVSVHRSIVKDGMASMEAVDSLTVPAGGRVVLQPGGLHLMLMQPERRVSLGDTVQLELTFAEGHALQVTFKIQDQMANSESGQ